MKRFLLLAALCFTIVSAAPLTSRERALRRMSLACLQVAGAIACNSHQEPELTGTWPQLR